MYLQCQLWISILVSIHFSEENFIQRIIFEIEEKEKVTMMLKTGEESSDVGDVAVCIKCRRDQGGHWPCHWHTSNARILLSSPCSFSWRLIFAVVNDHPGLWDKRAIRHTSQRCTGQNTRDHGVLRSSSQNHARNRSHNRNRQTIRRQNIPFNLHPTPPSTSAQWVA